MTDPDTYIPLKASDDPDDPKKMSKDSPSSKSGLLQRSSTARLEQYRERQHGSATHMDHALKKTLDRAISGDSRPELAEHHVDPENALTELLRHVHLDPDGGIANLSNANQDLSGSTQLSKIAALTKSPGDLFLAFVGVIRGFANPLLILFTGAHHLTHVGDDDWTKAATPLIHSLGHGASVNQLITFLYIFECGTIVAIFLKIFWDLVYMLWVSRSFSHAKLSGLSAHPRYVFLAKLFWRDLPFLQSFSGMKALGYIHPDLIGKNARHFFVLHHQASRHFVERFLQVNKDTASDEELAEDVAKILIRYDHAHDTNDVKRKVASDYLQLHPYGLSQLLLKSSLSSNKQAMSQVNCNPSVLFMGRWIKCIVVAENLGFVAVAFGMTAVGCLVFLAKLCIVARALGDINTPVWFLLLLLAAFLNQVMGIISVNQLLLWRVEAFVFGGSDAHVSPEEYYLIQVYLANLAETVWNSKFIPTYQKIAIMLKMDDDDLQQLIIEEDAYSKSAVTLSVKKFMYESGVSRPSAILHCLDPDGARARRRNLAPEGSDSDGLT